MDVSLLVLFPDISLFAAILGWIFQKLSWIFRLDFFI